MRLWRAFAEPSFGSFGNGFEKFEGRTFLPDHVEKPLNSTQTAVESQSEKRACDARAKGDGGRAFAFGSPRVLTCSA
jgi:hypothetical protein